MSGLYRKKPPKKSITLFERKKEQKRTKKILSFIEKFSFLKL